MKTVVRFLLAALFLWVAGYVAYQAAFAGEGQIFSLWADTNYLNYLAAAILCADAVGVLLMRPWAVWSWVATLLLYASVALAEELIPESANAVSALGRHPGLAITFFAYWIIPFLAGLGILAYIRASAGRK